MATTKPRVHVTLEPHRYDLLRRLAGLQGVSMSHVIADLLETVAPPLERVVCVLEAAQVAQTDFKSGLLAACDRAEASLLPAALAAVDQFDLFIADASAAVAGAAQADTSPAADAVAQDPRPVITGVRSPGGKPRKAGGKGVSGVSPAKRSSTRKGMPSS